MIYDTLTPVGMELSAPNMLAQKEESFVPFSVRGPRFIQLKNGVIVYFFEAKYTSQLDEAPSCQVLMRSCDGGQTWGETRLMRYRDQPYSIGGAPVYDEVNDTLLIFGRSRHFKPGMEQDRLLTETDQIEGRTYERFWITKSTDGGLSWTEYKEIFPDIPDNFRIFHCPTPNIGIQLQHQKDTAKNGRLIIPCNHAKHENGINEWGAHLLISDDYGDTWHTGAILSYSGANESVITELSDGTIVYNCRNQGGEPANLRIQGYSCDGGETLTDIKTLGTLYDPICHAGFTSAVIDGKDYLFFSTPSGKGTPAPGWFGKIECWGIREALTLSASADKGKTWKPLKQLSEKGVFSAYSALLVIDGSKLLCAWESGPELNLYRDIKGTILDLKELVQAFQ